MKWKTERVTVIETQLDDLTGQEVGYLLQRLLEEGALDAICIPILMKKGRPGFLIQVLSLPAKKDSLCEILFDESPTLGIRYDTVSRRILPRREKKIRWRTGTLRVKERKWREKEIIPEFDDLIWLARRQKMPLRSLSRKMNR